MSLNIAFISSAVYPNGGASANRHMAYAKGLVELGCQITFFLLNKQDSSESLKNSIDGIRFEMLNRKGGSSIGRYLNYLKAMINAYRQVTILKSKKHLDALIILDTKSLVILWFAALAKRNEIKFMHERTEFADVVAKKSIWGKIDLHIYLKFILKTFDGLYVISDPLVDYYAQHLRKGALVEKVNMIVDHNRFTIKPPYRTFNNDYLAFCGSLYGQKDGVDILLRSFSLFSKYFPDKQLVLIGDTSKILPIKQLKDQIKNYKLEERVIFTGTVEREKIPELMINAQALLLARPYNRQAMGGFPTKLGEYLATGNPVVVTDVGDISKFLIDGQNAFISIPDNPEAFAEKLLEVFNNYERARRIGLEGQKLVFDAFDYKTQSIRLHDFIGSFAR